MQGLPGVHRGRSLRDGAVALGLLLAVLPPSRAADEAVTVETLLPRMADARRLAQAPATGERTVQFSSYDRASRLEGGRIVHQLANGDVGRWASPSAFSG